ncbi:hypothetical protein TWF481_001389 [Arthrobotrys musiformis]|uniref:Uncharacterized protein n=1 Tax=Arthrobotrys musiformis TaxID=47236 RepID=A0AAV9WQD7_9PEZI
MEKVTISAGGSCENTNEHYSPDDSTRISLLRGAIEIQAYFTVIKEVAYMGSIIPYAYTTLSSLDRLRRRIWRTSNREAKEFGNLQAQDEIEQKMHNNVEKMVMAA